MGATVRRVNELVRGRTMIRLGAVGALSLLLAGCSSDITRFDFPAFGLTDSSPTASTAQPQEPVYTNGTGSSYGAPTNGGYGSGGQPYAAQPYGTQPYGTQPQPYGGQQQYGQYGAPQPYQQPYGGQTGGYAAKQPAQGYGQGYGTSPGSDAYEPYEPYTPGAGGYLNPTGKGTKVASLPKQPTGGSSGDYSYNAPAIGGDGYDASGDGSTKRPAVKRSKTNQTITVGEGETLYSIAQSYGVSVSALMATNKLKSPALKPGQKLVIPGSSVKSLIGKNTTKPKKAPAVAAEETEVADADTSTDAATGAVSASGDRYTVRGGESLYAIARKLKVDPNELARINGINDPAKLKMGQILLVPGKGALANLDDEDIGGPAMSTAKQSAKSAPKTRVAALDENATASDALPPAEDVAAEDDYAPTAPAASTAKTKSKVASKQPATAEVSEDTIDLGGGNGRFRWPVRGRIIGKFSQDSAKQNDGIDLAVPLGTDVHAAEDGVVAYAGDELKGYGKLVLIRHSDNWVSAYAHNDQILIKRGDTVRRGQVIAKAGKSGNVDQPMVHFELRKGSQPVDPLPHLASN